MTDQEPYSPRLSPCGSGYRVSINRGGYLYDVCDKRRRPITFRTFEGAKRRADARNEAVAQAGKQVTIAPEQKLLRKHRHFTHRSMIQNKQET